MITIHNLAVGIFVLAGLIFGAATVISMRKGHSDDSFASAMWALGSFLAAVMIA